MNQETLDIIGRRHTVEQVKEAFKPLQENAALDNINMDFIVGLPQEDDKMVRYSMEEAKKLNPEGITVHSLALKRAARLNIDKRQIFRHDIWKIVLQLNENNRRICSEEMEYETILSI